ncbi:MAG: hypothetical protein IPM12_15985 [Flavobacteriales bacterium]|nr:hypothetical protein [Flavobacteriales bacterium]
MKLVVDANILFSAVLSKDGLVAETFHEAPAAFTLIAPSYITEELVRLRPKMAKSARKSLAEIEALQRWALARVKLVSEDVIGSCTASPPHPRPASRRAASGCAPWVPPVSGP